MTEKTPPQEKTQERAYRVIGTRPSRHDGTDKVTGRALFGADVRLPGMLYGKVLRSPHAHARIRAIRTHKAEALPGVKAVVTAANLPDIADKIADLGGAPFGVKKIDARISIRLEGAGEPAVIALDENGYATSKPVSISGDGIKAPLVIQLAEDSIYYVVQRYTRYDIGENVFS